MTITAGSAEDLIATIPYSLGFHPRDSVVAVLTRDGRLRMMARLDLPGDPAARAQFAAQCDLLMAQLPGAAASEGHLVVYGDGDPGWEGLLAVGDRLAQQGLEIPFAARVHAGRWCHLGCLDPGCAGDWHPMPEPADCPTVAELVGHGRTALPDRALLAAALRPDPRTLAAPPPGERRLTIPVPARRDWLRLLRAAPPGCGPAYDPSPAAAGRLVRSLIDRDFRDALIAALAPGTVSAADLPASAVARVRGLLVGAAAPGEILELLDGDRGWDHAVDEVLCARTSPWRAEMLQRLIATARLGYRPVSAHAYAVVAFVAGGLGQGTPMVEAMSQALAADPDHRLTLLLQQSLDRGVFPFLLRGNAAARTERRPNLPGWSGTLN